MQQMQSNDSSDELIVTKIGEAVRAAMAAKESLQYAIAEAIDSSTTFGYELGAEDMKLKIVQAFADTNSEHSNWAISIVSKIDLGKNEL